MPRAQLHSCASPGAADGSHDIALNQCLKSIRIRGARASEAPRSRRIRLMELDVSAPAVSSRARSIRTQKVRKALRCRVVVDDCAGGIRQPDVELVVNTRFSRVSGAHGKVDVRERRVVRPGRATDLPGTDGLACLRVRTVAAIIPKKVPRNAGPVNVQAGAVIDVFEVAPGRRTVLASARDAEVRLGAVVYDPSATSQEIAGWQRSPRLYWRCCRSPNHQYCASHDECR